MKKILLALLLFTMVGCSTVKNDDIETTTVSYQNKQKNIESKNIFMFVETDASYAVDVYTPDILANDKSSDAIIVATIGDIENALINNEGIATPINIVDYEVLKGELDLDLTTIYSEGGLIDVESYMTTILPQEAEKMGLTVIPESERETQYIQFILDSSFDYLPGERYVFILSKRGNDHYINTEGYGTFTVNEQALSKGVFDKISVFNVLTDNELVIDLE